LVKVVGIIIAQRLNLRGI